MTRPPVSHRERLERLLLALEQVKDTALYPIVHGAAYCEYIAMGLEELEAHANNEGEKR